MLATLPVQSIFEISNQKNRIFSLVRAPVFGHNILSGNGQGPEKPVIEEVEVEEKVFTFAYPEERGEISDIVNPPVEGIAGEVLNNKGGVKQSFGTGVSSDILQYVSIRDSDKREALYDSQPEFVSLTRQPEIAASYRNLLVYSGYGATEGNFSYNSEEAYESPAFTEKEIVYESGKPLYEGKFPMPMISKRVDYMAKGEDKLYVKDVVQPELQTYGNIQEESKIQPIVPVSDVQYNTAPDLNFKLDLKLDYESTQLELPLVRTELPVLNMDIERTKSQLIDLHAKIDNIPKYDIKSEVNYETIKDILPSNLGFDDTLIRDRFVEGLKAQVEALEKQDIKLHQTEYIKKAEVKIDSIKESAFQYNARLDSSLDNSIVYEMPKVELDPFALFNLRSEVQANYQSNIGVKDVLLPAMEYNARGNLDNLVKVGYHERVQSLQKAGLGYNSHLVNAQLKVNLGIEADLMDDAGYEGIAPEQNLEEAVEREQELTEEETEGRLDDNAGTEVYDDDAAQDELYEKSEIDGETETKESSNSAVGYLAGAVGLGLVALLSSPLSLLNAIADSDNASEYLSEEPEIKQEELKDYGTKKCTSVSAKDNEYDISNDFAKTTQIDGEKSKKLCFGGIDEKNIDNKDFAKTSLPDSGKEGTKKFCFKEITGGDNGYINIEGVGYKSHSTLTINHEYRQKLQNNPEKSIINIRGKDGGDLTAQYEVSNKSIIAALYAYAMDDTENGGKGLTLDVRLDRNLNGYENLNEGMLMVNGIFGLDDFDSQYIVQAVKRDESGKVTERFFPRGDDGGFLSLEQELPELYKDYDMELVRLESKGEKEWQKSEDINSILSDINQDSQRMLENGGYTPVLSQLTDENGESIGRAYLVGDRFQITKDDIKLGGTSYVGSDRGLDRDENHYSIGLNSNGLLAILDRKLKESGLNAIHKIMPTQKDRSVLNDSEVYIKGMEGLNEQLAKLHSYVPKERWSLLIVEEDPLTGELSEPGYNPETGMQFTPEVGKNYRIVVGDGSDISKARIKTNSIDYQKIEQSEVKKAEPIPV